VLLDRVIARLLPAVPKAIVRGISARYIAGTELADVVSAVRALNASGRMATVDVLGEEISSAEEAAGIRDAYLEVLTAIERERLDANLSVKLTALGLKLGYELARDNLTAVVGEAAERSNFVRVDMEDSSTTDAALRLYRELSAAGHDNLGIVLQAYLRRTLEDVAALAALRPNVRLCKGIYREPSELAFQDDDEVRDGFVRVLEALLDAGCYVAIATHDELLIGESLRLVREHGLGRDGYELQVLLGVRPERVEELVAEGHRLRVYVPFGRHWYAYSLRRLQENPRIAGYIAGDTLRRIVRR
jgi:proline dehydrogenase